jgi:hypothetical protein
VEIYTSFICELKVFLACDMKGWVTGIEILYCCWIMEFFSYVDLWNIVEGDCQVHRSLE